MFALAAHGWSFFKNVGGAKLNVGGAEFRRLPVINTNNKLLEKVKNTEKSQQRRSQEAKKGGLRTHIGNRLTVRSSICETSASIKMEKQSITWQYLYNLSHIEMHRRAQALEKGGVRNNNL